jgi:hypothetical protein
MSVEAEQNGCLAATRETFNYPLDDENFSVGFIDIVVLNDEYLQSNRINYELRKAGRPERFRVIRMEDRVIAEGIWSTRDAGNLAANVSYDENSGLQVSSGKYKREESEKEGVISFQVDPAVIDVLENAELLQRRRGGKNKFKLGYPGQGLTDKLFYLANFEVSIDETSADSEKVWFNLKVTALEGRLWNYLSKKRFPKIEIEK